jgi:transcriptional regulator with XRE-family HTH domain
MPTPKRIGRTLKRLREARGLTATALAEKAGISQPYVSKLEAGRSAPTTTMVARLAKALEVPWMDLLR